MWLLRHAYRATLITVVLSAVTHLTVVFIGFLGTGNVALINPIVFLGLDVVAPGLVHSVSATVLGWITLVGIGSGIWFVRVRRKLPRIVREYRTLYLRSVMSSYWTIRAWVSRASSID